MRDSQQLDPESCRTQKRVVKSYRTRFDNSSRLRSRHFLGNGRSIAAGDRGVPARHIRGQIDLTVGRGPGPGARKTAEEEDEGAKDRLKGVGDEVGRDRIRGAEVGALPVKIRGRKREANLPPAR